MLITAASRIVYINISETRPGTVFKFSFFMAAISCVKSHISNSTIMTHVKNKLCKPAAYAKM